MGREALRFYEKKGLLPKAERTASGYREFPEKIIEQISFIKTAKQAGFRLSEIKGLIDLREQPISCQEGREVAQTKKNEILAKINSLEEIVTQLENFINSCSGGEQVCELSFNKGCRR